MEGRAAATTGAAGPHPGPLTGLVFGLTRADDPVLAIAGRLLVALGASVTDAAVLDAGARRGLTGILAISGAAVDAAVDGRSSTPTVVLPPGRDAVLEWAASGAMALTGDPALTPRAGPGALVHHVAAWGAVASLLSAVVGRPTDRITPAVLGERAAISRLGAGAGGLAAPGGHCRLVPAADAWIALSLARAEDVELLPALLLDDVDPSDPWRAVERVARDRAADDLVARAQLLGIPAARAALPSEAGHDEQAIARGQEWLGAPFLFDGQPVRVAPTTAPSARDTRAAHAARRPDRLLVVDLSSLWAGPLASSMLRAAGAVTLKVESTRRPDGARRGPRPFFDLLHGGAHSVALDFSAPSGRAALGRLLEAADVVIEASRPRALEQLGFHPDRLRDFRPDQVWLSITGWGRTGPRREWVAFGDDAAVAGGAATLTGDVDGPPQFAADALADPLAGLAGAVGVLATLAGGTGGHIDVALREVVTAALADADEHTRPSYEIVERADAWVARVGTQEEAVGAPRARSATASGPELDADGPRVRDALARADDRARDAVLDAILDTPDR